MMVPFVNGWTSLVESSAIGALTAFLVGRQFSKAA